MGETFLININLSKILQESEASVYTMFIDSSKMSIVYELVEWIRWMFSLKNCFYLTHENSVIHELEDIRVLSRLKYFELIPCGQPQCVHKKCYRALLKNLNLLVPWNETKVHKYFLDKINQMSQKLLKESPKADQNCAEAESQTDHKSCNTTSSCQSNVDKNDSCSNISHSLGTNSSDAFDNKKAPVVEGCSKCTTMGDSPAKTNSFNSKQTDNFSPQSSNKSNDFSNSSNVTSKSPEGKKKDSSSLIKSSPSSKEVMKTDSVADEAKITKQTKPKPVKKHPRPFSLGEMLTNIREDFQKKKLDVTPKENISQNTSMINAPTPDEDIIPCESYLVIPDKGSGTKRQRTRKRKRPKKQNSEDDAFSPCSADKKGLYSLNIPQSNTHTKPNHIRFDVDADDYAVDSEFVISNQNDSEEYNDTSKANNDTSNTSTSEFPKNGGEELVTYLNGDHQDSPHQPVQSSLENSIANQLDSSPMPHNQVLEEKITHLQNEAAEVNQSFSSVENFGLNHFNNNLSELLLLREKFKKGVVVQRFY